LTKNKRIQQILVALIIISLLPVFYQAIRRIDVESQAKQVEVVIDTEEIYLSAIGYGDYDIYLEALADFKAAGATTATLYQKTLKLLEERGDITVLKYPEAATLVRSQPSGEFAQLLQGPLRPMSHYILMSQAEISDDLLSSLAEPIESLQWRVFQNQYITVLEIPSGYWDLYEGAGLWYDLEEFEEYLALGFDVQLRPANRPGISAETLLEQYLPFVASDQVTGVIVTGTKLPGTQDLNGQPTDYTKPDTAFTAFVELLREQNWYYGLVETMTQLDSIHLAGDEALLHALDFQAVRVYAIQRAELDKKDWLTEQGIQERWLRAAVDRNIRVVYLRLFENQLKSPDEILKLNQRILQAGVESIQNSGYEIGPAIPLEPFHLVGWMILIPLALAWTTVLFLMQWGIEGKPLFWWILIALALPAALAAGYLSRSAATVGGTWVSMRQLLAFAAQVIYPVMAGIFTMKQLERLKGNARSWNFLLQGVYLAVGSFLIVFAGGVLLGVIMSDNTFMLELQYFRGVKVGFVLPLLILGLWYFMRYGFLFQAPVEKRGWKEMRHDLKQLLASPITVLWAIFAVVAAGALFYYVLRSGNASVGAISGLELKMRAFLERVLVARPRNKEFLIGYPAIMLIPLLWAFGQWFLVGPLLALATVGWVSVVNSFAHVRSGMWISMNRGLWGLALGVILGIGAAIAVRLFSHWLHRYWEEDEEHAEQAS